LKKDFSRLATGESEENTELELKALALIHNLANLPVQNEAPLFRETYEKLVKKGTVFPEKTQEDLVPVFTPKPRIDAIPPKIRREINEIKESLNVVIEILNVSKNQTQQEIEMLKELMDLLRKGQNNLLKYIQENENTLGETGVNDILTLHGRIDSAIVKYEEMKSEPPLAATTTRSVSVQSTPTVTRSEIPARASTQNSTTVDDDIFSSFVGERVAKLSIHPPPPAGTPIQKPVPMSFMVAPAPALNLNQIPMATTTISYPPLPIPPQMSQPNPNPSPSLYPQNFIPSNSIPMGANTQKPIGYVPLVPMVPMIPTTGTSFPKTSTTNTTTNGTKNNDAKPVWLEFDPLANK